MENPHRSSLVPRAAIDRGIVIRDWLRADSVYLLRHILFIWKQLTFNRTESEPEVYSQDSQPLFSLHGW